MQEQDVNKQLIEKKKQIEELDTKKQVQCLVFCKKQQQHVYKTIEFLKNEVLEHQDTLNAAFLFASDKLNDSSDLRKTILDITKYAIDDINQIFQIFKSQGPMTENTIPDILDKASQFYRNVQGQVADVQDKYQSLQNDYQNQLNLVENLVVQKKQAIQSDDQKFS